MKVIVDTSVWSQALRRQNADNNVSTKLQNLILEGKVVMLGCIRQELLSGIKFEEQFQILRDQLRAFPDEVLHLEDYEMAARCFNRCRKKGVQGSNTDFLICATAMNRRFPIFTLDRDFALFQKVIEIEIFT